MDITAELARKIDEIHATVVLSAPAEKALITAALRVIEARHSTGDGGWDRLKDAIAELEELLPPRASG